jgi:hypothetical protein
MEFPYLFVEWVVFKSLLMHSSFRSQEFNEIFMFYSSLILGENNTLMTQVESALSERISMNDCEFL